METALLREAFDRLIVDFDKEIWFVNVTADVLQPTDRAKIESFEKSKAIVRNLREELLHDK